MNVNWREKKKNYKVSLRLYSFVLFQLELETLWNDLLSYLYKPWYDSLQIISKNLNEM